MCVCLSECVCVCVSVNVHVCVFVRERAPFIVASNIVHMEFKISQRETSKQNKRGVGFSTHAFITRRTPFTPPGFTLFSFTT